MQEAVGLIAKKDNDAARGKLREAARTDPEGLQASFLGGLINAFARRDFNAAKLEFQDCLRRQPRHVPSLNNLALVEIRLGHYDTAVVHWKAAVDAGSVAAEITHNLGRLSALCAKKKCSVSKLGQRNLDKLQEGFSRSGRQAYDAHKGWLYMPFDPAASESRWIVPDSDMPRGGERHSARRGEDTDCLRCGGRGSVKCATCKGGGKVQTGSVMQPQGRDPVTGRVFGLSRPVYGQCHVCNGTGKVRCPNCGGGGTDPDVGGGSYSDPPVPPVTKARRTPRK